MENNSLNIFTAPSIKYHIECIKSDGLLRWQEDISNLVTLVGKTDIVDKYLKGSSYTAAWYIVLASTSTISNTDTLGLHSGWTELTPYSGSNRPLISWGATASGQNISSAVVIPVISSATVAGAGIANSQTGTSGTLYSMAAFSTARSVINGDSLVITMTIIIA